MTRMLWRIGGSALTVAMLGFGSLQTVSQLAYDRTHAAHTLAAAVHAVDIRIDSGSIDVEAAPDRTTVAMTRDVERGLVHTSVSERVEGDTLVVRASCPFLSAHCEAHFRLDVPPGVSVIARADGHVRVRGVHGDVDARTSQGRISLDDVWGRVRAHASEGSVDASALHSAAVDASASQGGVTLRFAVDPSDVVARTSEGSVHVSVPRDGVAYRVDAHASQGSTTVAVPTDPAGGRRISARSSQGSVTVTSGT